MILAKLRAAMIAAIPGIDAPKKAFFRVQKLVVGRFNLQPVDASTNQTKDLSNIEVCPGVPGVTSEPTPGEEVIVAFVGADGRPYVIARASEQMVGHIPKQVYHDAERAIRFVSKAASSAGIVYVGTTTVPVAKGPPVTAGFAALLAFATECKASADPTLAAKALILEGALQAISGYSTTKLEAE
jgi:hypothetical protein